MLWTFALFPLFAVIGLTSMPLSSLAKNLFRLLREFDQEKVDIIIAEGIAAEGLGLAVMNRLIRAASFNVMKTK